MESSGCGGEGREGKGIKSEGKKNRSRIFFFLLVFNLYATNNIRAFKNVLAVVVVLVVVIEVVGKVVVVVVVEFYLFI